MRALVKQQAGPGLELVERPEPDVGPDDVKIRVAAGRPVRHRPAPRAVGRLGRLDGAPRRWSSGTSSSARSSRSARTSPRCRSGRRPPARGTSSAAPAATAGPVGASCASAPAASASTATAPSPTTSSSRPRNVWVQPDDLDPDLGAVFDPLGNAVHTALQLPDRRRGRRSSPAPGRSGSWRRRSPATSAPATSSSPTSATTAWTSPAAPAPTWRSTSRRPASPRRSASSA